VHARFYKCDVNCLIIPDAKQTQAISLQCTAAVCTNYNYLDPRLAIQQHLTLVHSSDLVQRCTADVRLEDFVVPLMGESLQPRIAAYCRSQRHRVTGGPPVVPPSSAALSCLAHLLLSAAASFPPAATSISSFDIQPAGMESSSEGDILKDHSRKHPIFWGICPLRCSNDWAMFPIGIRPLQMLHSLWDRWSNRNPLGGPTFTASWEGRGKEGVGE